MLCCFIIAASVYINSAMENLMLFETEFPPACKLCFETKDKHMAEFVEFLRKFYKEEMVKLIESVYKIVEPSTYCQVVNIFNIYTSLKQGIYLHRSCMKLFEQKKMT